MSKLQGLQFLKDKFAFHVLTMSNVMLYKNLPAEKHAAYLHGLANSQLLATETGDLLYFLQLVRHECLCGIQGEETEGYDPYFNGDGNPPLEEPRPYDAYREMGWLLHPETTPYGLGLSMSPLLLESVGFMLDVVQNPSAEQREQQSRLVTRDSDEGEWRPYTAEELARRNRQEATELMEATAFTVGFNDDMARLRQLVTERGDLNQILELIGPVPIEQPIE